MTDLQLSHVRKSLGSHGHPFQYAVVHRATQLNDSGRSPWQFEVSEFPVESSTGSTRIDFVLSNLGSRYLLVGECKRADPAKANWLFARADFTAKHAQGNEIFFQSVSYSPVNVFDPSAVAMATSSPNAHISLELRSAEKGDGFTQSKAIEEATGQVLRGASGLLRHIRNRVVRESGEITLVPVIVTTARLWFVEGKLGEACLLTGQLPADWGDLRETPWLWYTVNQAAEFERSLSMDFIEGLDLPINMGLRYTRSIAIVSSAGLDEFLCSGFIPVAC